MRILWNDQAWNDYLYWQEYDRKIALKINRLVKESMRDPFRGIGKPEPLRGDWKNYWSRRITKEDRLVYVVEDGVLYIFSCKGHYE